MPQGGGRSQHDQKRQYPEVCRGNAGDKVGAPAHRQGGAENHRLVLVEGVSGEAGRQGQESAGPLLGRHQAANLNLRESQVGPDEG